MQSVQGSTAEHVATVKYTPNFWLLWKTHDFVFQTIVFSLNQILQHNLSVYIFCLSTVWISGQLAIHESSD